MVVLVYNQDMFSTVHVKQKTNDLEIISHV